MGRKPVICAWVASGEDKCDGRKRGCKGREGLVSLRDGGRALIVLLVVGLADEELVPKHKPTRAYSIDDFHLLKEIISNFEEMKVIPNALTEASNLLSFEGEGLPAKLFAAFSRLLETAEEIYIPSSDALRRGEFRRLGLGDAAILETGKADCHILSADVGLYLAAVKAGYKASNFTHAIAAARV